MDATSGRSIRYSTKARRAEMKTPIVRETRRAGQTPADSHRRQVALVARSLLTVPARHAAWDERTRTEQRAA
jgi:hypothetical protein